MSCRSAERRQITVVVYPLQGQHLSECSVQHRCPIEAHSNRYLYFVQGWVYSADEKQTCTLIKPIFDFPIIQEAIAIVISCTIFPLRITIRSFCRRI